MKSESAKVIEHLQHVQIYHSITRPYITASNICRNGTTIEIEFLDEQPLFSLPYFQRREKSPEVLIGRYDLRDFYQVLLLPVEARGGSKGTRGLKTGKTSIANCPGWIAADLLCRASFGERTAPATGAALDIGQPLRRGFE